MHEKRIRFDLRKAMMDYQAKTGIKLTYEDISLGTSLSVNTLKSLATRERYNATLSVIESISNFLSINPIEYFSWSQPVEGDYDYR